MKTDRTDRVCIQSTLITSGYQLMSRIVNGMYNKKIENLNQIINACSKYAVDHML